MALSKQFTEKDKVVFQHMERDATALVVRHANQNCKVSHLLAATALRRWRVLGVVTQQTECLPFPPRYGRKRISDPSTHPNKNNQTLRSYQAVAYSSFLLMIQFKVASHLLYLFSAAPTPGRDY